MAVVRVTISAPLSYNSRAEINATVSLALPMILGQGAQMAMHVIDTAMVGRLGVAELAASSMGNNAAALFFFCGIALGTTVPVLAARAFAARDSVRMNLVLRHGLTISLLYAMTCIGVFTLVSPFILPFFGSAELASLARPYAIILIVSLVPALLVQNLRGFTEAQMRPWLPLGNILLGVGLNVVFNYGLIYGNFGLPALGLPGAALGTLLARCVMLGHYIWVLRRHREVTPTAGAWRPIAWKAGFYGDYLRLAVPSAAMIVVWIGNNVAISALMGHLGPATLAAHEIVRQLSSLLFTLSVAFQAAIAIRVAQAAGAGETLAVYRIARSSLAAVLAVMGVVGSLIFLMRHALPRAFLMPNDESDVVSALASSFLTIAIFGFAAEALSLACVGVFRGLSAVRTAAGVYLVGMWGAGLPLAALLGFSWDGAGVGIWQGVVIANSLTSLILVVLLARALRRHTAQNSLTASPLSSHAARIRTAATPE